MSELFERSCEHWSAAKRHGMEDFYALATADYRHLAEAIDWRAFLEERQREAGERPLRLLDVACGSGKFPAALVRHAGVGAARVLPIDYALLDPSPFSLAEARSALAPPFAGGVDYEIPLQDLDVPSGTFDIVWATHALYALPEEALTEALSRFLAAMRGGVGVIAHAASESHYVRWQELYLEAFQGGSGTRFVAAEAILETLADLGAEVDVHTVVYETCAPAAAEAQVEGFLQRCVFDDDVSMSEMRDRAPTGEYLAACRSADGWRFPQQVALAMVRA